MEYEVAGTRCCARCKSPYGHVPAAGRCCHPVTTVEQLAQLRRADVPVQRAPRPGRRPSRLGDDRG